MGRPRHLPRFNEFKLLKAMTTVKGFQTWQSVQDMIETALGTKPSRRSVFRLMKRWSLGMHDRLPGPGLFLTAAKWVQPPETVDRSLDRTGQGERAIIWHLVVRGGANGFMFTADESEPSLDAVATALAAKESGKNRLLRTAHEPFAKALRKVCPEMKVEVVNPRKATQELGKRRD